MKIAPMRSVELFAGAGGLGMGVSNAGFHHAAVVEWNADACATLRDNKQRGIKPVADWPEIYEGDVRAFDFSTIGPIDLAAGGCAVGTGRNRGGCNAFRLGLCEHAVGHAREG